MRIVIDLQSCQSGSRFGGIGRYSLALAKAMIRQPRNHEFWIILNSLLPEAIPGIRKEFIDLLPPDRIKTIFLHGPVAEANLENQVRFKAAALTREYVINELQPDFVHVSSLFEGLYEESVTSLGLLTGAERTAVTLYDLIPLVEREKYLAEEFKFSWYKSKLDYLEKAGLSLSISEYSRQEALDLLQLPHEKVVNISSAIDSCFRKIEVPPDAAAALRRKLGIKGKFLMYTGSFDQRKNHELLLKAYASLPRETRTDYQLVIVGNGWDGAYNHLRGVAETAGMEPTELIFSGHISDIELLQLYNICSLFVFPSLREGFGLPVLEAMSCGVPTIGSNRTSIPEVIGMQDALFDPTDFNSIGKKIYECLTDISFYNRLLEHAVPQAAKFSWDRSAITALDAIEACHKNMTAKSVKVGYQVHPAKTRQRLVSGQLPEYRYLLDRISEIHGIDMVLESDVRGLAINIAKDNAIVEAADRIWLKVDSPLRVGWVTTWNTRCGIATYSIPVIKAFPAINRIFAPFQENLVGQDEENVVRCWNLGGRDDLWNLSSAIENATIDALVVQLNYGFYDFPSFADFLQREASNGRVVFVIIHSTIDPPPEILDRKISQITEALSKCFVFVHSEHDVVRLAQLGLCDNVFFMPLGMHEETPSRMKLPALSGKKTIATYGFALPNKGLIELVDAFEIEFHKQPDLHLLMVNAEFPAPESTAYISLIKGRIAEKGLADHVTMVTDYLSNEDSLGYLACADLVVIPYQHTSESSSGSARMALGSGRVVAVTPLPIFDDMRSAVFMLPGTSPEDLAKGIEDLLGKMAQGDQCIDRMANGSRLWVSAHGFSGVGEYLFSKMLELRECLL